MASRHRLREVSPGDFLRLDPIQEWEIDLTAVGFLFRLWRVGEASRDMFVATPHWIGETRRLPEKEGDHLVVRYMGAKPRHLVERHLREQCQTLVGEKGKALRAQLARRQGADAQRDPGTAPTAASATVPTAG